MATTQYIGARYVPIIVGEWDKTRTYEPLMVVTYQGASYTSRQYVPAGIEITNENYWVLSANYNAQIEQYRKELRNVLPYDETPTEGSTKGVTSDGIKKAITAETTRATAAEKVNADAIAAETTRAKEAEQTNETEIARVAGIVDAKPVIVIIGDSFSTLSPRPYSWPSKIPKNYTVKNFAAGGAGFTIEGNKFITQVNSAINDSSFKNSDVSDVFVYGGLNDFLNNTSWNDTIYAGIVGVYNACVSAFTNAKIHIVTANSASFSLNSMKNWDYFVDQVDRASYTAGIPIVNAYSWLFGFAVTNIFNNDKIHPNELGQSIIAANMQAILNHSYDPMRSMIVTEAQGNAENKKLSIFTRNGEIYLRGGYTFTNVKQGNTSYRVIPDNRYLQPWSENTAIPFACANTAISSVYFNGGSGQIFIVSSANIDSVNIYF